MQTIQNAAVFHNGQKKMTRVNVIVDKGHVLINNGTTGALISDHKVILTAKNGMAWDVEDAAGNSIRLTIQEGCGCGGMKHYANDPGYSGQLGIRGEVIPDS